MHAIMGLIFGAFLATLLPELWIWSSMPTGFRFHDFGLRSWLLSAMALGVLAAGVRDVTAARIDATEGNVVEPPASRIVRRS